MFKIIVRTFIGSTVGGVVGLVLLGPVGAAAGAKVGATLALGSSDADVDGEAGAETCAAFLG